MYTLLVCYTFFNKKVYTPVARLYVFVTFYNWQSLLHQHDQSIINLLKYI